MVMIGFYIGEKPRLLQDTLGWLLMMNRIQVLNSLIWSCGEKIPFGLHSWPVLQAQKYILVKVKI